MLVMFLGHQNTLIVTVVAENSANIPPDCGNIMESLGGGKTQCVNLPFLQRRSGGISSLIFPGLSLAHWTPVPLATVSANATPTALMAHRPSAIVRANAAATALLALRPLEIVRAKKSATALRASRPLAIVVTKIQVFEVVQTSVRAIQRKPTTFLPQRLPAGSMAILRN